MFGDSGQIPDRLTVEVYDVASHVVVERTPVNPNGSFALTSTPRTPEGFDVRVVNQRGDILRQERFSSSIQNGGITLRVASGPEVQRPAGEVVSVRRLHYKPAKKARKLFDKAEAAMADRNLEESVNLLQKAVQIDPDYMEAFNNLGSRLLQLNRPAEAAEALRKAIAIDPAESKPFTNLAIALLQLHQLDDAERAARQALALRRDSRHTEYVLGLILVTQKARADEALALLRRASAEWPHATLVAGILLTHQGNIAEARQQFATVLKTGAPAHQKVAKEWLSKIGNP